MKKVVLITTGRCEQLALAASLKRYFPSATFEVPEVHHSFTSSRVKAAPTPPPGPRRSETVVEKLASSMVAKTDPGRDGVPPDLVIAVDDVELVNVDQVDVVVAQLRDAVKRHLDRYAWPSARRREQAAQRIREHCSFHLLCPMVEAYFYGEPPALERAGARLPSAVDANAIDLEDFVTDDAPFLAVPDREKYWATSDRRKHPKRYIQYLCDPEGADPSTYRESDGGAKALRALDWSGTFSTDTRAQLARSLFADLAEALEVDNPFPGTCHPFTSAPGPDAVLRNL